MKLDLKELINKLLRPINITPSADTDLMTMSANWTIRSVKVYQFGRIKFLVWVGKYTGTWGNGTQLIMGVLKTPYQPLLLETGVTSISTLGVIAPNGTVYVRNASGNSMQNVETTYCAIILN